MSLLRSYSFGSFHGYSELPKEVLNLFVKANQTPNKKIEFASEIISNGLQGRIDFTREFNLDAYEATIRKNQRLNLDAKKRKETYIDYSASGDDWSDVFRTGGMTIDAVSASAIVDVKDAFEQLMDDEELKYAIESIKSLQPVLFVEEQVDFIGAIKDALNGIPNALATVKEICDKYDVVAEQVKCILSSGYSFEECFG